MPGQVISRKGAKDMFNDIASSYDRINRILSLGIDLWWRKGVKKFLPRKDSLIVCDLATGTADQIISLSKGKMAQNIKHFYGFDIAKEMLSIGEKKLQKLDLSSKSTLALGSALEIPLEENSTDFVTMSFGIRNVEDPLLCLQEIHRILKPGGCVCILEFSLPKNTFLRWSYLIYLRHILPKLGKVLSRHSKAYTYLNQTIETFPHSDAFLDFFDKVGFSESKAISKTFGVVSYYVGIKS